MGINQQTPNAGPYVTGGDESTSQAKLEEVMFASASDSQSETAELAAALRNKAQSTKGLSPAQKAAYDKQILEAMQNTEMRGLSDTRKLTVAAVVPGALGVLQPSGSGQAGGASEAGQMANADMQNMLQKQQRTMQTMSNISKTLHDTAKSVIRKIGG